MNSNSNNQSLLSKGLAGDGSGIRSSRKQAVPKKLPNKQIQAKIPTLMAGGSNKGGSPNLNPSDPPATLPTNLHQKGSA
jgi:hypothetical protein